MQNPSKQEVTADIIAFSLNLAQAVQDYNNIHNPPEVDYRQELICDFFTLYDDFISRWAPLSDDPTPAKEEGVARSDTTNNS